MGRVAICRCVVALSLVLFFGRRVCADIVPVQEDVTVNAANEDSNLNNITTRGGLLSGLDDTGSNYSFFLKFNLAALNLSAVKTIELVGTHTDDFGPVDSFHQVYFVADDSWSETTVTWNTRPATEGLANGGLESSGNEPGDPVRFDITQAALREADGDGILSLGITTIDGRSEDLEFFAAREYDPTRAFRLETSGDLIVIPLPPATLPGAALMLIGLARCSWRGRWLRG